MQFETINVTLKELVKLRQEWLINHNKKAAEVLVTPYDDYFYDNEFPITVNKKIFELHSVS